MPKTKATPNIPTKAPAKSAQAPPLPVQSHAIRETVESIVIAFVLAFLFRTFEAEAFVIPTGSMAPTLMGRHKDVVCPKCGYRYQVSASEEESEDPQRRQTSDCIAGKCPMCHYVLPMRPDLPQGVPEARQADIPMQRSYNGDRILVNKYIYSFSDPKRWDVVVFKFPGDAKVNYIKRLVGLPGEKLRIYQGDIFLGKEMARKTKTTKSPASRRTRFSRCASSCTIRITIRPNWTQPVGRCDGTRRPKAGQKPGRSRSRRSARTCGNNTVSKRPRAPIRGCATKTSCPPTKSGRKSPLPKPAAINARCSPTPIAPNGGDSSPTPIRTMAASIGSAWGLPTA